MISTDPGLVPPVNTHIETSKPNKYYQKISRENKKSKIVALLSSLNPREVKEGNAIQ